MGMTETTNFVFKAPPPSFAPCQTVVSLMCWDRDRCLFLRKAQGLQRGRWGVPGGKVQRRETSLCAMQRELIEETGLFVPIAQMHQVSEFFMRTQMDYKMILFSTDLTQAKDVYLSKEHSSYRWLTIIEALSLDLLRGQDEILTHFTELYRHN